MPIQNNRYFNDPAFAAAAGNIASMFAPPSGSDAAGFAAAKAKREEAQRLSDFFDYAQNPEFNQSQFDRLGVGAGVYAPNQSYYGVDQGNLTAQRGQDVTARTSLTNNAADNARALEQTRLGNQNDITTTLLAPVAQNATRFVPPSVASMYDLPATQAGNIAAQPGEQITTPDGRLIQGAPKPLSETEWQAGQNERLRQSGGLTDDMLLDAIVGERSPVQVVGENGPVYSSPGAAARQGLPAFVNKGAEAKPTNGTAVIAGRRVAVMQGSDGIWKTQDGTPIPTDTEVFDMAKPQGSAEEVGLSKPTNSQIEQQLVDIAVAKDTATQLRDMVANAPAAQGVVGWLRGTAQDFLQTGGELAQHFGGNVADVQQRIQQGAEEADLAGAFDPRIPTIEMMANLLAFQYAKTTTGERLSNEMLKASRAALGLTGLNANQASSVARLTQAINMIESQEKILKRARGEGVNNLSPVAPPAPDLQADTPPERVRTYNPATGRLE